MPNSGLLIRAAFTRSIPRPTKPSLSLGSIFAHSLTIAQPMAFWVSTPKQLLRLDATGAPTLNLALDAFAKNPTHQLLTNVYDESVWALGHSGISHLTSEGNLLGRLDSMPVRQAAIGLDGTIWLLGNKNLNRMPNDGSSMRSWDLHPIVGPEPKLMVLDSIGDRIWIAGEKSLVQMDTANPAHVVASAQTDEVIRDIAIDEQSGTAYVLAKSSLKAYSRDAGLRKTFDLAHLQIRDAEKIVFDHQTRSVWVAHNEGITRLSAELAQISSIRWEKPIVALAATPFKTLPIISLIKPPANLLTTNPTPEYILSYGAACGALPCDLSPAYYALYKLNASLNGIDIGNAFVYDALLGQAFFKPGTRLPEGENHFIAQAQDRFGHVSNIVNNTMIIDTIAPQFLNITPASGSVVSNPIVRLHGSVDDPDALILLEDTENWGEVGQNPSRHAFSFEIRLKAGVNTLSLIASDKAGNLTTKTVSLTYVPPTSLQVNVISPIQAATVTSNTVNVVGTFAGPLNTGITVNGIAASLSGNKFAALNVPLEEGANTLTIVATTLDGLTVTKTLSVTRAGSSPYRAETFPSAGIAPLEVQFSIENLDTDPITRIDVDFEGDGSVDFTTTDATGEIRHTYRHPGVFEATLAVANSVGSRVEKVVVVVQDPTHVDQLFNALWKGMNDALIAKDKAKALGYLNTAARTKYAPVFEELMPYFSGIVTSYSLLQRVNVSEDIGEYAVNRLIDSKNSLFLIYFLKDVDGIWRIDSM